MEEIDSIVDAKELELAMHRPFPTTDAPVKIYCDTDGLGNIARSHNIRFPDGESMNIEYIRKDVVEHIIMSSLNDTDAMHRLHSL